MGDFIAISIKNKLFKKDSALKKYLNENDISHYLFTYDLMEYNFKDIYESFRISYFTKDKDLLAKWVEKDELQDYESVEADNIVLIKKFKLRITVKNDLESSNEIVASDDYDFDFNNLSHSDSLIKIAIVRDNLNEWINSGKLAVCDYVFTTNKEYIKELKMTNDEVFPVKGESIFLQFKNIFNLLYMRRKEKFYRFINSKFHYVFPKMKNYFRILNSEFFEDEWYRNSYNIPDNTDPAIHYLLVGYTKGFNPGPDFDSWDYYEINRDIEQAGLNPLLHYEQSGRRENRQYKISSEILEKDLSTIRNSEYFDEDWYSEEYDLSKDLDLTKHYLKIGYKIGNNPGPNFDNEEYYECNIDVKGASLNPLLHYEQYGREECRIIHVSEIPKRNYYLIEHSSFFDKEWYQNTYNIPEDVDPVEHYLNTGFKEGNNPGPDFNTQQYYGNHLDAKEMEMNPLLHYELYVRYSGE